MKGQYLSSINWHFKRNALALRAGLHMRPKRLGNEEEWTLWSVVAKDRHGELWELFKLGIGLGFVLMQSNVR